MPRKLLKFLVMVPLEWMASDEKLDGGKLTSHNCGCAEQSVQPLKSTDVGNGDDHRCPFLNAKPRPKGCYFLDGIDSLQLNAVVDGKHSVRIKPFRLDTEIAHAIGDGNVSISNLVDDSIGDPMLPTAQDSHVAATGHEQRNPAQFCH